MTNQELQTLAGPDIVQPRPGLYKVSRTSDRRVWPLKKPCDGAAPTRVTETLIEWVAYIPDIMAFVDKHGDCIVGRDRGGWATIEIYDDWSE